MPNTEIGSYEAKTTLPDILRRVGAGEEFTITNRGKPVADLIPSRDSETSRTSAAIQNILAARKHAVSDEDLLEMKNEGRK